AISSIAFDNYWNRSRVANELADYGFTFDDSSLFLADNGDRAFGGALRAADAGAVAGVCRRGDQLAEHGVAEAVFVATIFPGTDRKMRTTRAVSERRVPELDGLRGCAILMVVFWHYVEPGNIPRYVSAFGRLTWSGVDLFFVLSGFLIGGILLDARSSSNFFQVFYTRRFFRIVPIYAAVLLIVPTFLLLAQRTHHGTWLTPAHPPWYFFWT